MRTKTLLLTAALSAAGIASSMAQVYSVNAVGYVNRSIDIVTTGTEATFALVSNPLNGTNNLLSTILPTVPGNTSIYLFRNDEFDIHTYFEGVGWIYSPLGEPTISPGEGFWVALDPATASDPTVLTFVGEVPQGNLHNTLPNGFSLRASQVPMAGGLQTDLGLVPAANDEVYLFDVAAQTYETTAIFVDDGMGGFWIPSDPQVDVAESFWFNNSTGSDRNWDVSFSVN